MRSVLKCFLVVVVLGASAFHAAVAMQAGTVIACRALPVIWREAKLTGMDAFDPSGDVMMASNIIAGAVRNWPALACYRGIMNVWLGNA